jgi:probable rRNA maturation factor
MPTNSAPRASKAAGRIAVQFGVARRGVPAAHSLAKWAHAAGSGAGEVTLRIVGAAEGRRLNRAYRRKDYATNVLTFGYGERPWRGDIVLCHPVIAREARVQGKDLVAHYAHLVVHGMLHLRGFEHESEREATAMERAEKRILRRLGFDDPYAVEWNRPE